VSESDDHGAAACACPARLTDPLQPSKIAIKDAMPSFLGQQKRIRKLTTHIHLPLLQGPLRRETIDNLHWKFAQRCVHVREIDGLNATLLWDNRGVGFEV
jgi:hypothetical protein